MNLLTFLKKHPEAVLYLSILLSTLVISYFAILKHYAFMSTGWDLGIYEQVMWSTVNTGRLLWYTPEIAINPSCNFFGIHFAPILFLILPVYAMFQVTETLLVLQAFVIALAAVPLYKLVVYESSDHKQALVFAILYLTYPPMIGMAFFDFHVQAVLPFLLFSAFYFFKKEEWRKYFLFVILSLMVIEFIPLIVASLGLYGLWVKRKEIFDLIRGLAAKRVLYSKGIIFPAITILLGIFWLIIARNIILSINPDAPPHPNWASFGDPVHGPLELVINVLTNPLKTLEAIVTPVDQKLIYVFGLFAPLLFLSFLDPPSLLIGGPWFLVAFMSSYASYYAPIGYQYVALVVTFVFVSAFYGYNRLLRVKDRFRLFERSGVVLRKLFTTASVRKLFIMFLVIVVAICYVIVLDVSIMVPVVTEHHRVAEKFTRLVPPNASVLTQNDLLPHLSKRLYVFAGGAFQWNVPSSVTLDNVLVDSTTGWYTSSIDDFIYNVTVEGAFGVQYAADGIFLLKRGYSGPTIYPIGNGVVADFFNQGVTMKIFDDISMSDEPVFQNVTSAIVGKFGDDTIWQWNTTDLFAVVWEGWLYSPVSGSYLFQIETTGSCEMYLDGGKLSNISKGAGYRIESEVKLLERGFHHLKVEYVREPESIWYSYAYFIRLLWSTPWDDSVKQIQSSFLYSGISPEFSSVYIDLEQDWGYKSPFALINADHFTAFMNCSLQIPTEGIYKFRVLADDYVFLYIDGELSLTCSNSSGQNTAEVYLTQGAHSIEIAYMDSQDEAYLNVIWQTPGESNFEDIPFILLSFH